ncbi:MAG TPA: nodulation protein NfeD [Chloroflexia bacterium]|nr:nodulation protein NfeD [Chloroflexia bacterium]
MGKASKASGLMRAGYILSALFGLLLMAVGSLLQPVSVRANSQSALQGSGFVYVAPFKLPITPVSAEYYNRLIKTAEDDGAAALVVQINTPGGLVESMQGMVERTLASRVPVIAYVSPDGAMSASAGVFIVYSSHVAAMAPNTVIGSSEVLIQGGEGGDSSTPESGDAAALRRKVTNLLVSQIRNLADQHGRNADFGERAVRESANLQAQAALDQKVVDVIAPDVNALLDKVDGRQVNMKGERVTLHTKGAAIRPLSISFGEEILLLITNPSVAFVLISLGTLGLTWEFINPGSVFPGVVGAILLLIGFLGLGTLPINSAGLVFLLLAFVLFIADVFMPSHGILTAGGITSLVLGGLLLINTGGVTGVPVVSPFVVTGVATGLGAFFFFAVIKVFQARKRRPSTGRESLVGSIAQARTDLDPRGMVYVAGELWHAESTAGPVPLGVPVRVTGMEGLLLKVRPE